MPHEPHRGARRACRSLHAMQPRHNPGFGVCRSKKRAVLIGIKYTGRRASELRGPINDVKCMKHLLTTRFGFPSEGIIILTDEEMNKCRLPTKENIRMAMHWLVQRCSNGDSLVFQFSGIGTQVPDEDGDERDCMDEALCPMDSLHQGPILDDEINAAIVRPLVHGAKLHALVDAHHSATVLDLPYQCVTSKTTGCLNWVKQPTPNGVCKSTSGGRAVLISGSSGGKKMPAKSMSIRPPKRPNPSPAGAPICALTPCLAVAAAWIASALAASAFGTPPPSISLARNSRKASAAVATTASSAACLSHPSRRRRASAASASASARARRVTQSSIGQGASHLS
ncbi:hypothetical protein ACQ4PT_034831 [Festuca glaucescens]